MGRNASSAFLIVDVLSVKNTDTAVLMGYDADKKVSGIKRHITVITADLTDSKEALQALQHCKPALSRVHALLSGCGRTARGCSTPACSSYIWRSWRYRSKDFEQALSPSLITQPPHANRRDDFGTCAIRNSI